MRLKRKIEEFSPLWGACLFSFLAGMIGMILITDLDADKLTVIAELGPFLVSLYGSYSFAKKTVEHWEV